VSVKYISVPEPITELTDGKNQDPPKESFGQDPNKH